MILLQNPFYILDVSTRDRKDKIIENAEERSLSFCAEECEKAKVILTNPRKRIEAEASWLPGFSPNRARKVLADIQNELANLISEKDSTNPLLFCNLLGTMLLLEANSKLAAPKDTVIPVITFFCEKFELICPNEIMLLLNEDRKISGFPEITSVELIEQELKKLQEFYIESILVWLKSTNDMSGILAEISENLTEFGEKDALFLLEQVVDRYHLYVKPDLDAKASEVRSCISSIKYFCNSPSFNQKLLDQRISTFEEILKAWDYLAQPIQVIQQSRGASENHSEELGWEVRDFGLFLANEHGLLETSHRLAKIMSEVFAELPAFAERVTDDIQQIGKIIVNIKQEKIKTETEQKKWEQEVSISSEWGLIFKDRFKITPQKVILNANEVLLEKITGYGFSLTENYRNGIHTGSTCEIIIHSQNEALQFYPPKVEYTKIIEKLWPAAGFRIFCDLLSRLGKGEKNSFCSESITIDKYGILLPRSKYIFFSDEPFFTKWEDMKVYSSQGCLCIESKSCANAKIQLSYLGKNVFILDRMIHFLFKDGNYQKLISGEFN